MTRYEIAKALLEAEKLPTKQTDNLGVLEGQVLKFAQDLYTMTPKNIEAASLEEAKEIAKSYFTSIKGAAVFLLIVGADIHHFRMASLSRYLEVPPEMRIEDIINRLTTRDCDVVHDDTPGHEFFRKNSIQEKGKEEEKETFPPAPPIEKKGEEIQKESPSRARARKGKKSTCLTKAEKELFNGFFNTFWEEYPTGRKVDRYGPKYGCEVKLKRHFKKAEDKEAFVRDFLESFHAYLACPDWAAGYVPLTTTFINQERWKEKPRESRAGGGTQRGVSQTANVKSNRAKGLW